MSADTSATSKISGSSLFDASAFESFGLHGCGHSMIGATPAEQHEALQHGRVSGSASSVSSSSSVLLGELVFDKFTSADSMGQQELLVKSEQETPPLFSGDANTVELSSHVVESFFESSSDSTPLLGLDGVDHSSNHKEWSSLFDDDIPVTIEDVAEAQSVMTSVEVDMNTGFLPTPVIENMDLSDDENILALSSSALAGAGGASAPKKGSVVSKKSSLKKRASSSSGSVKYDHLGVISYNRKQRAGSLTPVVPESDDPVALKRARNTEAARRSRARKLERMNQLEERVEELLQRNIQLEDEVGRLKELLKNQS
ncbi:amino acid starvation-responsive transcription factor GCN4 Ecym_4497 [Eremothecium cymbalariae DBVPG|uniref:BZIP domain-containing protein n=1 Tax=Eremothecium cymbalariae (strain CBS 270.75 / DBVPG 7215 / KCTC 17166 / NRRL Y-17582) TaxID=931890 RepID=G8JU33_ERECY|nr:hypothetical protein Ecym_4497 [Eremothecium cymbalariae DBVPG\